MENLFDLESYYFDLPADLIAQEPLSPPDNCRLLIVNRRTGEIKEDIFKNLINILDEKDVLVLNDTKVIKARLFGNRETGAKVEVLLLKKIEDSIWEVLLRPAHRVKINEIIIFLDDFKAKVLEKKPNGIVILDFFYKDIMPFLERTAKIPLPHYIKKDIDDFSKYQTVYAKKEGAVAAPTAGLHFTNELLKNLEEKKVKIVYITLHCGLATFRSIKSKDIRAHTIEAEWVEVSQLAEKIINEAKKYSNRIIAVGTTSVRTLEAVSFVENNTAYIKSFLGEVNLYITPEYKFKIIDGLITNFHTPYSSNLVLVASFCGLKLLKEAYQYAIREKFRFFSFGDAMLII